MENQEETNSPLIIARTCAKCSAISRNYILVYITKKCTSCNNEFDKIYVYECGHLNCCVKCYNEEEDGCKSDNN